MCVCWQNDEKKIVKKLKRLLMRFVFQFVIHSQLFTVFNWIWIISFHLNNNKICPNWDSNGRMLPGMGITMHNCIQIDGKLFDCVWPWYLIKWRAHSKCAFPECRWTSGAESWDWNSTTNRELEYFGIATSSERLHSWTMVKKKQTRAKTVKLSCPKPF